jgi:transposase
MRMEDSFSAALGLPRPWKVHRVNLLEEQEMFEVHITHSGRVKLACPTCGQKGAGYDTRSRRWRHLDACGYQTWLLCDVPRMKCSEHGVVQVAVPWAEARSRFTAPFECAVIDWLHVAPVAAVARMMRLSWGAAAGIQARAVARGLERRGPLGATRIGADETSFRKRHRYVTIVSDQDGSRVLHVTTGRRRSSLESFYKSLPKEELAKIESVAMDMHQPFVTATAVHVPDAEDKIAFDKFHVIKLFTDAVDKVRRVENRALIAAGDRTLVGSKYHWVMNPRNMKPTMRARFKELRKMSLKVGRACALKEAAQGLWHYTTRRGAAKAWLQLCAWAQRTRLEPLVKVGRTIRRNLLGILNAIVHNVTNAGAEGMNSRIQGLKKRAHGYRNEESFIAAIYFHLGGLDLYPAPLAAHTDR